MDEPRWVFTDPPNLAVITVVQVLRHGMPVLYVSRDADDGAWQFLAGESVNTTDSMVVALHEMIRHDTALEKLSDLPVGWCAWRKDKDSDWERRLIAD